VHADEQLLVVDKASGLQTVPGVLQSDSLIGRLAATGWPTAQIVHRLDRDTSGLLVIALDRFTHSHLSAQFRKREVTKTYTAVVAGHVEGDSGKIDLPIRKDMVNTPLQLVDHGRGKPSQTLWRVIDRLEWASNCTRLELTPLTGRTHQLRLHLSAIGHPICGDDLYADAQALEMAPRLCLHAERLDFMHPGLGCERMRFRATTEAF
jgi:tRNA pseudouridine32 synthase/23S rRNA pseudouridine746 synthase